VLAVFLLIWMASALQAISCADFVLDIDRLSTDVDCRKKAMEWFQSMCCPVDFSDCAIPSLNKWPVAANEFERVLTDTVTAIRIKAAALVIAEPEIVRKKLESLSPLSGKILRSTLENQ